MELESPKYTINVPAEKAFAFLSRVENYERIMPASMEKFQVLSDSRFLFALKGMPDIVLEIKDKFPSEKIVLGSASEKLPFTLTGQIRSLSDESCEIHLAFKGDFNPMMAMMIQGPIREFIGSLSQNMNRMEG